MCDFTTKTTKPSMNEYWNATEKDLLERLNNNPGNLDTEFPFIKAVLDVKTAESIRKTNKSLVIVTWILCIATIVAAIISGILAGKWNKDENPNESLQRTEYRR